MASSEKEPVFAGEVGRHDGLDVTPTGACGHRVKCRKHELHALEAGCRKADVCVLPVRWLDASDQIDIGVSGERLTKDSSRSVHSGARRVEEENSGAP